MKKISILAILLLFVAFSCQQDAQIKQDQFNLSLTELTTVAANIGNSDIVKSIRKESGKQGNREISPIEEIVPIPDQKNPSYYIVNFKRGGWVIVSADKRVNPILAFSDESKFQTSGEVHYGLKKWMGDLDQTVKKVKAVDARYSSAPPCPVAAMWNQVGIYSLPDCGGGGGNGGGGGDGGGNGGGGGCTQTSSTTTVGPLITVQWAQGCGYNRQCPTDAAGPCEHDPTGCEATAMAQVMYYWKKPTTYNWAAMQPSPAPDYPPNQLTQLMHDAGVSIDTWYTPTSSGAYGTDIAPAFMSQFGYQTASYDNFNLATAVGDLAAHKPVILTADTQGGFGHCWVTDGYLFYTANTCGTITEFYMLDMNWGWGGINEPSNNNTTSNGWYSATNWAPSGTSYNFKYVQKMVHNIHP